jgi:hypothetical protein
MVTGGKSWVFSRSVWKLAGLTPPRFRPMSRARLHGMDHRMTTLERAFQLARSGEVLGLTDIMASLKRDGYATSQIEGPLLRRQLSHLIKIARAEGASANRP